MKEGIVIAHHGKAVWVELIPSKAKEWVWLKRKNECVIGDEVEILHRGIRVKPRKTLLQRQTPFGVQVLAANVEVLAIVVAPKPHTPLQLIDLAIISARLSGIEPVLVLHKKDLPAYEDFFKNIQNTYPQIPLLPTCVTEPLEGLKSFLSKRKCTFFMGVSGSGKSSLLNALVPDAQLKVGALLKDERHGSHQTTVATLHHLPNGGDLIDAPGIRNLGLVQVSPQAIAQHFPGFEDVKEPCKFVNCTHQSEPGCGIKEAIQKGLVAQSRYEAYLNLL